MGSNIHTTAARGVHKFLDHVARVYTCKQIHTLSPTGLLATNTTNIRQLSFDSVKMLAMKAAKINDVHCIHSVYQ